MEVCIFGVLTVNLLTFCSQIAPLPSECALSRCLLKMAGWALAGKSSNALLQPVLRAYMMAGTRLKWWLIRGLNDGWKGAKWCLTRGWIMHHDGMGNASRGKNIFITMEKNRPREAEKRAFKSRKTMSCGAENYGLVFLTLHFLYIFHACSMGFRFFLYLCCQNINNK